MSQKAESPTQQRATNEFSISTAQQPGGPLSVLEPCDLKYVTFQFNNLRVPALIDSGACRTVLRRNEYELICKRIGRNPVLKKAVDLFGVTGHQINVLGETQLDEQILGPITVIVVEGIGHPMVLGRDIMNSHAASLNYATSTVTFGTSILPMVQAPPYALLLS